MGSNKLSKLINNRIVHKIINLVLMFLIWAITEFIGVAIVMVGYNTFAFYSVCHDNVIGFFQAVLILVLLQIFFGFIVILYNLFVSEYDD